MGFVSRLLGSSKAPSGPRLARPYKLACGGFSAVVGESHYQENLKGTARLAVMERDDEGEDRQCFEASLVREPENAYDPRAVVVNSPLGVIGYVPRDTEWCELLDRIAEQGHDGAVCKANLTGGDRGRSWGVVLHARAELELAALDRLAPRV